MVVVRSHSHVPNVGARRQSERTEVLRVQKKGLPWHACDTWRHRKRKDKSECVLAVHIKSEKAFLADEAKAGVQPEGSGVVHFSFKDYLYSRRLVSRIAPTELGADLARGPQLGCWKVVMGRSARTSSAPVWTIRSIESLTNVLAANRERSTFISSSSALDRKRVGRIGNRPCAELSVPRH